MAEKPEIEQLRRELKRKSLDTLIIYNPLDEPITTIYEGYRHVAPPKEESTFPRYIAEKLMREYIDRMINEEEQTAVNAENEKRRKRGVEIMNPEERWTFATRKLLTDNQEKRMNYMKTIYRGISKEHGLDIQEPEAVKRDSRTTDEKLLAQLDAEMGIVPPLPEIDEVEDKKEELLEKIK